jgi:TIR domain
MANFKFDFALSFAGEDRIFVQQLANELKARGAQVFYDDEQTSSLWGEDLGTYLDRVYRIESRFAIIVVSKDYVLKMWTTYEYNSALARAIEGKNAAYILPIRLDDSEVPGLRPTLGFIDGRQHSPAAIAELANEKLQSLVATSDLAPKPPKFSSVPLTPEQRRRVATERPGGWEYLLLAGAVWQEVHDIDAKFLDHQIGFAEMSGQYVDSRAELSTLIQHKLHEAQHLIQKITMIISTENQEWAVGTLGNPGDAIRIERLAFRFGSCYQELLSWAASLRGVVAPDEFTPVLHLLARFTDEPIDEAREFSERLVSAAMRIIDYFAADEPRDPLNISLAFTLTLDDDLIQEFNRKLKSLPDDE